MDNKLNIILNGKIVKGYQGETILQLAKRNGIEIPTLCNDDRLTPYSSCYVCVVEVEGMRGLQPSCSTKIVEGMKITTDNDKVHKSRKSALELLLSAITMLIVLLLVSKPVLQVLMFRVTLH